MALRHALQRHSLHQPARTSVAARAGARCTLGAFAAPLDVVCFTLIVDDIVFPDGTTAMACLGGGGPQTCFGLRLHGSAPGVVRVCTTALPPNA
jgi:hypothetical protein